MHIRHFLSKLLDGLWFYNLYCAPKYLIFKAQCPLGLPTLLATAVAILFVTTNILLASLSRPFIAVVLVLKRYASLRYFCVFLFLLRPACYALAQEQVDVLAEAILEQVLREQDESVDISEQILTLRAYLHRPMNLNTADELQLAELLFLQADQIANLLAHRKQTGPFTSVLELQGVAGFDVLSIERLRHFVYVGSSSADIPFSWKDFQRHTEHTLMVRYGRVLENQKGYSIADTSRSHYLGSADKYVLRYRMDYKQRVKLAINMKKDAGEPFFAAAQRYGFDHYGFSLAVKGKGIIKHAVLGDFGLQVGQGLLLWNGLSFGKGSWIGSIAKRGAGLAAYSAMGESNFLRGLATQLQYKHFSLTPFVSFNSLSGNRYLADGHYYIGTIATSGLHRTATEQRYRKAIKQWAYGADLSYTLNRLKIGSTFLHTQYNGIIKPSDVAYNRYAFAGDHLSNVSLNYQYTFLNTYIYGETSYQLGAGWATNNGLLCSILPSLSLLGNYRYYHKSYFSPFGQSLQEGSAVANEQGLYGGLIFHPSRAVEWTNYVDFFSFPSARYRVDKASKGMDMLSQFTYLWYKKAKLSLRYRYRLKQENSADKNDKRLEVVLKHQLRLDGQHTFSSTWRMRSRVEWAGYRKGVGPQEYGWLFYQDVFWQAPRKLPSLNIRVAYFNTESYNSRIYAYENDVLYASSFPVYQHQGWRYYINCQWRICRGLDLWMRYGQFQYLDQTSVGSGLDWSEGSHRSTVSAQIRWQW